MRRAIPFLVLLVVLAAGAGVYFAGRSGTSDADTPTYHNDGHVQIKRPGVEGNDVKLQKETVDIPKTGDPIEHTLKKLLETADDGKGHSAIPSGTRLRSIKVEDGVATVDLSVEFNKLRTMGDQGESLAQNALCDALAQFPKVKSVKVLVEGKPFEGEHADWSEPIPVRDDRAQAGGNP